MTNSPTTPSPQAPRFGPVVAHSVITFVAQSLMQVVDLVFCRDLGSAASATIGTGSAFLAWFIVLGIGLFSSLEFLIPNALGSGEQKSAGELFQSGFRLSGVAAVLSMIGLAGMARLAPVYGMNPELTGPVRDFCDLLSLSIFPILLTPLLRIELQCRGLPNATTEALLLGNGLNVLLNWMWVGGHWGFPAAGVTGSAWANVVSRWFIFGYLILRIRARGGLPAPFNGFLPEAFRRRSREILRLGVPAALHMAFEVGAFILVGVLASRLDSVQNAAHAIAISLASFVFMIPAGLSSAAALTMGHALGRKDPGLAVELGRKTLLLGLIYASFGSLVFLLWPGPLISLYTTDPATRDLGQHLILVAGLFQFGDAMQVILAGCLRGLGETRTQAIMNAVGHWGLGIPLGLYLGFHRGQGVVGLWIGLCAGLFAVAALLLFYYVRMSRRAFSHRIPKPSS